MRRSRDNRKNVKRSVRKNVNRSVRKNVKKNTRRNQRRVNRLSSKKRVSRQNKRNKRNKASRRRKNNKRSSSRKVTKQYGGMSVTELITALMNGEENKFSSTALFPIRIYGYENEGHPYEKLAEWENITYNIPDIERVLNGVRTASILQKIYGKWTLVAYITQSEVHTVGTVLDKEKRSEFHLFALLLNIGYDLLDRDSIKIEFKQISDNLSINPILLDHLISIINGMIDLINDPSSEEIMYLIIPEHIAAEIDRVILQAQEQPVFTNDTSKKRSQLLDLVNELLELRRGVRDELSPPPSVEVEEMESERQPETLTQILPGMIGA